jgi:hypothetical protein
MSSDVMQHELVERARESRALSKADITKAWLIYWLGAEVSSSYERLQSLVFCASMTPIIKKLYPEKEEQAEALKRHLNFLTPSKLSARLSRVYLSPWKSRKPAANRLATPPLPASKPA